MTTRNYDEFYAQQLQTRLDVIETIRGDLNQEKITVPGIIVCGSQSAGKSSVLESIGNIPFPKGKYKHCHNILRRSSYNQFANIYKPSQLNQVIQSF